jgi:hypothetical protein
VLSQGQACPAGAGCFQVSEATAVCLDLCGGADGDCRSGYACQLGGSSRACTPACKSDADCDEDEACNISTGECQQGRPRAPSPVGGPCQDNSDCVSQICLAEGADKPRFPGGYCVQPCSAAEENRPCSGQDGICVGLPRDDGTKGFACLGACRTGVDCRAEYMCSAEVAVQNGTGVGMCLPRCEHYNCDAGETCDTTVGICTPGGATSTEVEITYQDLGMVAVGPSETEFGTVAVNVAPGAVSFSIIADGVDPKAHFALMKVVAPGGQVVFDYFDPLVSGFLWRSGLTKGEGALVFPNAPRVPLVAGTYQVSWGTSVATSARMSALQKRQSGVVQAGSLPVVFWFTNNQYLNAQSARNNPAFQQAVATMSEIYRAVGITLGPVSYVDLTGTAAVEHAVIDQVEELTDLFSAANSSNEKAINFFMVDQLLLLEGGVLLGVAGGIPGPPAYPGLTRSGVAVALSYLEADVGVFAETMAHEGGHYLGLFHLSERGGDSHDPLLDTPECTATSDQNRDGAVTSSECAGRGIDNLMFWGSAPVPQRKLTNDQRFVLLRNPTVR